MLPAAAMVEMALAAVPGGSLEAFAFERLLVVPDEGAARVQVVVSPGTPGTLSFELYSAQEEAGATFGRHARGTLRPAAPGVGEPPRGPLTGARHVGGDDLYARAAAQGFDFGPAFRTVIAIEVGSREAAARIAGPERGRYVVHPALLDAAFQVVAEAAGPDGLYLPVGLERLAVHRSPGREARVRARIDESGPERYAGSFWIEDDLGVAVEGSGLVSRRVERTSGEGGVVAWLHEVAWEDGSPVGAGTPAVGSWLLVPDRGGLAEALAIALRARGASVEIAGEPIALAAEPPRAVVHLVGLDDPAGPDDAAERGPLSGLALVQALLRANFRDPPRLWFVTRGSQPAGDRVRKGGAFAATFWGLARSIAHEHPELRASALDLDPDRPAGEAEALAAELSALDREDQIAFRSGRRLLARLVRRAPRPAPAPAWTAAGDRPFRMELDRPGRLDDLALARCDRRAPAPGEVEIEVAYAGLNFLDVLLALGVVPAPGGEERLVLGGECSGRVVRVGEGVAGLGDGDEVLALAPGSLGRFVAADARLVLPRPAALALADAAAIPVVFATAWQALVRTARLEAGERVLVHAGAGGVGLAAIQIARRLGAEVHATAGSPAKRELLRTMGVEHVFDSRSLSFVEDVREATGGRGVDVVLNSLAGEFATASLELLAEGGRFVEIGKRDAFEGRGVPLRPFLRNLSYSLVDLAGMSRTRPAAVRALLVEVLDAFARGELEPIARTVVPIDRAADAFHDMAQARHVGKLVIDLAPAASTPVRTSGLDLAPDRTWLVTGGLGGIGLALARRLVERGARHLALAGRSAPDEPARRAIAALEAAGARVLVAPADVSREADVRALLAQIDAAMPPLAGVFHAAGLLEDAMLAAQTPERFRAVLAPKLAGTWHLHRATAHLPLERFVLFSSAAAVLGAPGQANYAAANAFLDALAHERRAAGLPALSVDWGPWAEVGLAARAALRGERLASRGLGSIDPEAGLDALERLLQDDTVQVAAIPIDVARWRESNPRAASAPFLARLQAGGPRSRAAGRAAFAETLRAAPVAERRGLLEGHLALELSRVLRLPAERVERDAPFQRLGVDSLLALEFRNRLEPSLGLSLPATLVWAHPSVARLAEHLASRLAVDLDAGPRVDAPPERPELTDDEGARILEALSLLAQDSRPPPAE